jgi:hypothetical protein
MPRRPAFVVTNLRRGGSGAVGLSAGKGRLSPATGADSADASMATYRFSSAKRLVRVLIRRPAQYLGQKLVPSTAKLGGTVIRGLSAIS